MVNNKREMAEKVKVAFWDLIHQFSEETKAKNIEIDRLRSALKEIATNTSCTQAGNVAYDALKAGKKEN